MKEVTWQDFESVHMHVGTILRAEHFAEARKPAYKLWIDFGEYGTRKSSAQITQLYTLQELKGLQIIAVLNFPPKQIANFISECLVLGAVDSSIGTSLITVNKPTTNGTRVL